MSRVQAISAFLAAMLGMESPIAQEGVGALVVDNAIEVVWTYLMAMKVSQLDTSWPLLDSSYNDPSS